MTVRLQNPFAALSPSGLDSQVLLVFARTEQYLSVQQVQEMLPEDGSRTGVQNSVARFVEQGTVVERRAGRSRTYALNGEHLLARPIREIASARRLLLGRMADAVAEWPIQPVTVMLFGSAARNEMQSDSDIDVLVVMPDDADDAQVDVLVGALATRAAAWTGNDVRPLVYRSREVAPAKVFEDIVEEGIGVAGDPAWLRRRLRRADTAS